jgi:hypothetical protein
VGTKGEREKDRERARGRQGRESKRERKQKRGESAKKVKGGDNGGKTTEKHGAQQSAGEERGRERVRCRERQQKRSKKGRGNNAQRDHCAHRDVVVGCSCMIVLLFLISLLSLKYRTSTGTVLLPPVPLRPRLLLMGSVSWTCMSSPGTFAKDTAVTTTCLTTTSRSWRG